MLVRPVRLRRRRGISFLDVIAGVFVLGLTVMAASAMFPISSLMRSRSGEFSLAAALAQKKMEELRRVDPSVLNYAELRLLGLIDEEPVYDGDTVQILEFTETDEVNDELQTGTGYVVLIQADEDLTEIIVYLFWTDRRGTLSQTRASTYISMKTPKVEELE